MNNQQDSNKQAPKSRLVFSLDWFGHLHRLGEVPDLDLELSERALRCAAYFTGESVKEDLTLRIQKIEGGIQTDEREIPISMDGVDRVHRYLRTLPLNRPPAAAGDQPPKAPDEARACSTVNEEAAPPKERKGLTIAEKACTHFHTESNSRLFEPDMLVCQIRDIIGDNQSIKASRPTRRSDELAELLLYIRCDSENTLSDASHLSLDEAIESCFLHSEVYRLALEIYRRELMGDLMIRSAYEFLQGILAKGGSR